MERQAEDPSWWELEAGVEPAWQLEEGMQHGGSAALDWPAPGLPEPEPGHPSAAAVLPLKEPGLMQLYTSVLDEQIALLECDLAQLESAPSPIAQLKQLATGAGRPRPQKAAGTRSPISELKQRAGRAVGGDLTPARRAQQQQQEQQRPQQQDDEAGSIAAWRPNRAFQAAPAPLTQDAQGACGMQQLMSPGGDTPGD